MGGHLNMALTSRTYPFHARFQFSLKLKVFFLLDTKQPSTASLSQIPDKAWFHFVAGSFLPYPRWTMNVAYSSPGVCVCVCAVFNYTWIYLTTAMWGPISKPYGGKNPMVSHGHEWHCYGPMGSGWTRLGLRYRTSLGTKGHDPHRGHQQDNPSISFNAITCLLGSCDTAMCLWPLCNTASYTSLVSVCFNLVRCERMGGWGDGTDSIIPNMMIPGLPGCFLERIPTRIFVPPTWPVAVNDGVPAFFLELHHAGFLMLEDPTSRLQNNSFSIFLLVRIYYIM